jgi:hypothetical protein
MVKFVPGFAAAIGAFVVLKLVTWLPVILQFLVFLGAYGFLAVAVDKSLKRYGDGQG